jgi:hypothetical protein
VSLGLEIQNLTKFELHNSYPASSLAINPFVIRSHLNLSECYEKKTKLSRKIYYLLSKSGSCRRRYSAKKFPDSSSQKKIRAGRRGLELARRFYGVG